MQGNTYELLWTITDDDTDRYTLTFEESDLNFNDKCHAHTITRISSKPGVNSYRFTLPRILDDDCAGDFGSLPEFVIRLESDCDYGFTAVFRISAKMREEDTIHINPGKEDFTVRNGARSP